MKLALLLLITCAVSASEPPTWVLRGILYTESNSYYRDDGSICYVDKRRGRSGERSAFQITRRAFDQVKRRGEQFWKIEVDQVFAEEIACRYLVWLYARAGSWDRAVEWYNAGPHHRSPTYLNRVRSAAR